MANPNIEQVDQLYQTYLYAFPLVVLDLHIQALTNTVYPSDTKAPINQLIHARGIATARDKEIVHPNIDTVYSKAHLDLSGEALYFKKPESDRYTSAELLDAYGNCVAIIGSGGIGGCKEAEVVLTGPGFSGEIPAQYTQVSVPTNLCWLLIRILKDVDDESIIRSLQRGFELKPLSAVGIDYVYPTGQYLPENDFIPYEKLSTLTTEEFFNRFNRLIGGNLGAAPDTELLERAASFGIGAGLQFRLSTFSPAAQEQIASFYQRAVKEFTSRTEQRDYYPTRGQWRFANPKLARFDNDYSFRAKVAWGGFGALPVEIAIYPQVYTDSDGEALTGDRNYICHFDAPPPVGEFWSLTAYGDDQFLIPNELDRNGFNDRSTLKYNDDGSFDLYIQRKKPDEDKRSNWLPTGYRPFGLVLRMYSPSQAVLDGTWQLPVIRRTE